MALNERRTKRITKTPRQFLALEWSPCKPKTPAVDFIMNPIVKNVIAFLVGIVLGCAVNLSLVSLGPALIPLPEGADVSTMEGLRKSMKLFTPGNFVFPFLGHALGTLAGAWITAKIAASGKLPLALGIGGFFLMGGITMVVSCGGPIWFIVADLGIAYLPMGYLGFILARSNDQVGDSKRQLTEDESA